MKRVERGDKVTDFEKVYKEYFNDVYLYISVVTVFCYLTQPHSYFTFATETVDRL